MKYKIIEIKLTPVTPFFFGKENASDLGNKNDYFQTSLEFPQQSTLLGFLRHKILRDNDINLDVGSYKDEKGIATKLVGNEGFSENNNHIRYYGMINSISPCFLIDKNDNYLWDRSLEFIKNGEVGEELFLNKNLNGFAWNNSTDKKQTNYLGKHIFVKEFIELEKGKELKKDKLLYDSNYVGSYKGGVKPGIKEDSFYIMEYKSLLEKSEVTEINNVIFSKTKPLFFGFLACIDIDCKISELPDFMPMGKERSMFKVETKIINNEFEIHKNGTDDFSEFLKIETTVSSEILKCILISDAKLNKIDLEDLNKITLMQVSNQQRFRYIKRKTKKFHSASKPIKENKAFNLLAKGSVLFFKKDNQHEIEDIFSRAKEFLQIGYNQIIFINAKTI